MVEMCGESEHLANQYCELVEGNKIYEQSMLNIVRGFPTPGIIVQDQQYVVADRSLAAGLFTPVATVVDAMNLKCYIHSEEDLPKEEEEEETEEAEENGTFGGLIEEWISGLGR